MKPVIKNLNNSTVVEHANDIWEVDGMFFELDFDRIHERAEADISAGRVYSHDEAVRRGEVLLGDLERKRRYSY